MWLIFPKIHRVPGRGLGTRLTWLVVHMMALVVSQMAGAGDDPLELTPPLDAPSVTTLPRLINPTQLPVSSTPVPFPSPLNDPIPLPIPVPALEVDSIATSPRLPVTQSDRSVPSLAPRAVLAIPGIKRQSGLLPMPTFSTNNAKLLQPLAGSEADQNDLTLNGPVEMRVAPAPSRRNQLGPVVGSVPFSSAETIPLTESTESALGSFDVLGSDSSSSAPRRGNSTALIPHDAARQSSPPPRRRFFGLFSGSSPVVPSPSRSVEDPSRKIQSTLDTLSPEAVAEARLKQRIEKQAREAIGDRARSIEVRVDGKAASIHARGVRFFQKRGVRRALEEIPALSGLRSTINVDD